ncbi:UDP-N-acetylmuramate dehydrogenase [Velocimicrobium porci]|uniref:UDP-N-acetylenolpyruvoylglucosamine reductase n=1 Tax=Velocimicrobium porci TaxID=2606634 RepID=A0A6L5XXQ3_9FIRM|nr:UDP-N-acetylmuramate dehydrogenase [Velocimicrobium porci]
MRKKGLTLNQEFILELKKISNNVKLKEEMKLHTTFRIGGPADYFVEPESKEEVRELLLLCRREKMPYYILGNGSNLLVGDKGFRGLIIQIGKNLSQVTFSENRVVTAETGVMLSKLAIQIAEKGYTGFEFAGGIPGTLGGAVTMNAGAYGGEIKDCIVSAEVIDEEGNIFVLSKEELNLGYRTSIIQQKSYIVLAASFQFEQSEKKAVLDTIADLNQRRREKQPLNYPSAGSTFKRPEGYFAGKLIMDAGLRGYRIGGIMVSEKHCGFVVNVDNGTAKEVLMLIEEVQRRVFEQFGVHLEPEVRMIGEF